MSDSESSREAARLEPVYASERPTGRRRSDRVVGASAVMQQAIDWASEASRSDLPVIVVGPSGSGRSHLARAIHTWSGRAGGPFITLVCNGVPEALHARELFGGAQPHRSAAVAEHDGALVRAAGGTLCLSRLESLAPTVLETLAKCIADGAFRREGESNSTALRARIVATSEAPAAESPLGALPHHEFSLASLDERPEDVLPLAAHFLSEAAAEEGLTPVGFTTDARASLLEQSWPGNVRELRERIRHATRLAGSGAISAEALMLAAEGEEIPSFKEAKRAFETRYVTGLLRRCGGNISRAARLAKKDRKDFYDVIRRTGVDPSEFRQ